MKSFSFVFIFFLSFFLSCSDDLNNERDELFNLPNISTRAIVDNQNNSVTNPDFINNWENMNEIILNSSSIYVPRKATLPWISGAASSIPSNVSNDIKKEDGWRMLIHTFKDYGLDINQNYFVLYNDFTGVLRFYYFSEYMPESNNAFMWNVKTTNSSSSYIIGANSYPLKSLELPSTDNSIKLSNYSLNEYSSLGYGWNSFELPITYSSEVQKAEFLISAINSNVSSINLLGMSKGTIDGKIVSTTYSENKHIAGAANLGMNASKDYLNRILSNKDSVSLAFKLRKNISDLVGGVVKDGIKGGLKFIVGNILQSNVSTTNLDINMTIQTKMEISGTAEFPSVAQIAPLSNYDLHESNDGKNLGVWTIEKTPKVLINRYSFVELNTPQWDGGNSDPEAPKPAYLDVFLPELVYEKPKVIINPEIQPYLKSQSVTYDIIICSSPHNTNIGYPIKYYSDFASFLSDEKDGKYELYYQNKGTHTMIHGFNTNFFEDINVTISGSYREDCQLVYDWAGYRDDTFILVVTVDQVFDRNGKETQVTSSKHFKADFGIMPNWYYIYPSGSGIDSYVVNKNEILN